MRPMSKIVLSEGWCFNVTFQSGWKRGKFDSVLPDGWMMQYFQWVVIGNATHTEENVGINIVEILWMLAMKKPFPRVGYLMKLLVEKLLMVIGHEIVEGNSG